VPVGKGVSSSAALEVATMRAICAVGGLDLEGRELALLCRRVENLVVGAPCGVMDQMTAAWSGEDRLLALFCQPAELQPSISLPPDLEVWGSTRAFIMPAAGQTTARGGWRLSWVTGSSPPPPATPTRDGRVTIADPQWHGYLANMAPWLWAGTFRAQVPEFLDGGTFLARYGGSSPGGMQFGGLRLRDVPR
jgi:galactokinase